MSKPGLFYIKAATSMANERIVASSSLKGLRLNTIKFEPLHGISNNVAF